MPCPNCIKPFVGTKGVRAIPSDIDRAEKCGYLRICFLERMQAELVANEIKGDWNALVYDYDKASRELTQHLSKLLLSMRARDPSKVSEHAADVAVIAMKVSETFGDS